MLQTEIKKINTSMEKLQESVEFISAKYDEITEENKELKNEVKDIKNYTSSQNIVINKLEKKCTELQKQVNKTENMGRFKNLELHGVPKSNGENVVRVAVNILKITDPELNENDVDSVFRGHNKSGRNTLPGPIIVALKTEEKRTMCFSNRKRLYDYNFNNIGIEAERIYLNENLCANTRQLLYKARLFKNENDWKFVWTNNGQIKMKKSINSPTIIIEDEIDLTKISNNNPN